MLSLFRRIDPFQTRAEPGDDAVAVLRQHHVHFVFKHSPACGLSSMAWDEVRRYLERPGALPVRFVDCLAQHPLSRAIAEATMVRHESPQILLVRDGVVQWHASHYDVTADALARSASTAASDAGPAAI
jgi:bacillithiol system protein YtxJ